jgi:hypothetical protein
MRNLDQSTGRLIQIIGVGTGWLLSDGGPCDAFTLVYSFWTWLLQWSLDTRNVLEGCTRVGASCVVWLVRASGDPLDQQA